VLWQSGVMYGEKEQTQPNNPYCSATPAADGERVIASFGSAGLYCYDFTGRELWHRGFGTMNHMFGNASSVILYGDLCLLPFGPDEKARLIAVNKRTGQTVWEGEPPTVDPGEQQSFAGPAVAPGSLGKPGEPGRPGAPNSPGRPGVPNVPGQPGAPGVPGRPNEPASPGVPRSPGSPGRPNEPGRPGTPDSPDAPGKPMEPGGSGGPPRGGNPTGTWSTPIIVKAEGRDEIIMAFPYRLAAYDPKTGTRLWLSKGVGATIYNTPVCGEGIVVAMSSGMGKGSIIAVRPGGRGDVTEGRRLWHMEIARSRTGSGVICQGYFFAVSDNGIADCTDLKTGRTVWEQQLKGPGGKTSSWSSLLLADGKIYVPNQSGDVFVFRAGPRFELLATNSVGESTNASLAASNNELFMRTDRSLWCFTKTH
jgi:outer membrane protein assembly factor BamB